MRKGRDSFICRVARKEREHASAVPGTASFALQAHCFGQGLGGLGWNARVCHDHGRAIDGTLGCGTGRAQD